MNLYRIWAKDTAARSVLIEANSQHEAERQAQELINTGEWEKHIEQDDGLVCEWEIIGVAQIPKT